MKRPAFDTNPAKQFYLVELEFAEEKFKGEGSSLQAAKHAAAAKAMNHFSDPKNFLKAKEIAEDAAQNKSQSKAYRPPQFYKSTSMSQVKGDESKTTDDGSGSSSLVETSQQQQQQSAEQAKSEIILVTEYAFRLKKTVVYELINESGPSHSKKYVTKCSIGTKDETPPANESSDTTTNNNNNQSFYLEVTGEGNSKKVSKKNASIQMLNLLKEKFEPLLTIASKKKKEVAASNSSRNKKVVELVDAAPPPPIKTSRKNKAQNIVKVKKTSPEYGKGSINPISRLIQIQQASKQPEPIFTELLAYPGETNNKDNKKKSEFTIQVKVVSQGVALICHGSACTKKLAKRCAAEQMLAQLGYQSKLPLNSSLKLQSKANEFNDQQQQPASSSSSTPVIAEENLNAETPVVFDSAVGNVVEKEISLAETEMEETTLPTNPTPALNTTTEKRVKFQENVLTIEQPSNSSLADKQTSKKTNNDDKKTMQHLKQQQRMKQAKEKISMKSGHTSQSSKLIDRASLNKIYKIARELLDSVRSPSWGSGGFKSATAETLDSNGKSSNDDREDELHEMDKAIEEKTFKMLNGDALNTVNYKKMLKYLAEKMDFEVIYQSLMGKNGLVVSYISLPILPDIEKPLNGQGSTHIESSNAAAFKALEYLSSKHEEFINTK